MKYKRTKEQIIEDKKLLQGKSLTELESLTGMDRAYLSRVRSGKVIMSEKKYLDLKAILGA
jgi:transcriptional regulator with XRE-family HTH domain